MSEPLDVGKFGLESLKTVHGSPQIVQPRNPTVNDVNPSSGVPGMLPVSDTPRLAKLDQNAHDSFAGFSEPMPPMCEHDEPCKNFVSRQSANYGRSFWRCARPGGQGKCKTFVWCSDWDTLDSTGRSLVGLHQEDADTDLQSYDHMTREHVALSSFRSYTSTPVDINTRTRPFFGTVHQERTTQPSFHIDQKLPCLHPDCLDEAGQSTKYFTRKADVTRHFHSAHRKPYIDCPQRQCPRKGDHGFTRRDHLIEHQRQYHGIGLPKERNAPSSLKAPQHLEAPRRGVSRDDTKSKALEARSDYDSSAWPDGDPPDLFLWRQRQTDNDSGYVSYEQSSREKSAKVLDIDDSVTVNTDGDRLSLPSKTKELLASALAQELFECAGVPGDISGLKAPAKLVQEEIHLLLKDLSQSLEHDAQTEAQRDTASFVRQQRPSITQALCSLIADDTNTTVQGRPPDGMSVEEKMALWNSADATDPNLPVAPPDDSNFDLPEVPEFSEAKAFLQSHYGFTWASQRLKSLLLFHVPEAESMSFVRKTVMDNIESWQAGYLKSPPIVSTKFEMTWPVERFMATDAYLKDGQQTLGTTLILAGSLDDALALTCAEYVTMIWGSSGLAVLDELQVAIDRGRSLSGAFRYDGQRLFAEIRGTPLVVAAVGEQLACLNSVFCPLMDDKGIVELLPTIHNLDDLTFEISSSRKAHATAIQGDAQSGCWHSLFKGHNLVSGYPLPPREHGEHGLEISLENMIHLTRANFATIYDGRLVLKGFSSLFAATASYDDSTVWHYVSAPLQDVKPQRIRYSAIKKLCKLDQTAVGLDMSALDKARHFVGWCLDAEIKAGMLNYLILMPILLLLSQLYRQCFSPQETAIPTYLPAIGGNDSVVYDTIGHSGCDKCPSGYALDKVTINGGKFLMVGTTIGKAGHNKSVTTSDDKCYDELAYELSKENFVLFDVEARRGYLLDGALLVFHMAIKKLRSKPYTSQYSLLNLEDLQYPDFVESTAVVDEVGWHALANIANRSLKLFKNEAVKLTQSKHPEQKQENEQEHEQERQQEVPEEKAETSFTTFADLIKRLWAVLEQMIDTQDDMISEIRLTARDKLEGYEFMDIIEGKRRIKPKKLHLGPSGWGWAEFTREIQAVTILGRGFGDLVKPLPSCSVRCPRWQTLKRGKDYLAAPLCRLRSICMAQNGDLSHNPIRLASNVYWHRPYQMVGPCSGGSGRHCCERVQELLPKHTVGIKSPVQPFRPEWKKGWVIFGRNEKWSGKWWSKDPRLQVGALQVQKCGVWRTWRTPHYHITPSLIPCYQTRKLTLRSMTVAMCQRHWKQQ